MTSDRKKPGVAFWATVVLVAVLAYPLSFGPACWIARENRAIVRPVAYLYWPLTRTAWACPNKFVVNSLVEYAMLGKPRADLAVASIMWALEPD